MIKEKNKPDRQANFRLSTKTYKKFRLIAASRGIKIGELYRQAAEEFCSKFQESGLTFK